MLAGVCSCGLVVLVCSQVCTRVCLDAGRAWLAGARASAVVCRWLHLLTWQRCEVGWLVFVCQCSLVVGVARECGVIAAVVLGSI